MVVLKRIVKLGGAAITDKSAFETIDEDILDVCVEQLRIVIAEDGPGEMSTCIVHGAGSFGHHTAAASGVAQGNLHREGVREGFVATRRAADAPHHGLPHREHLLHNICLSVCLTVHLTCPHTDTAVKQAFKMYIQHRVVLRRASVLKLNLLIVCKLAEGAPTLTCT